jgi:hypothetical protein
MCFGDGIRNFARNTRPQLDPDLEADSLVAPGSGHKVDLRLLTASASKASGL